MTNKDRRLSYIDAIRFVAVCLVVISHFNDALPGSEIVIAGNPWLVKSQFTHFSFGSVGVSLFFIISGVSLYYNYGDDMDVKEYFKKRFLGIYPTFWCSYLLIFLILFFKYKAFWFASDIPKGKIILTIMGFDGYLSYLGSNFYLIGEWFLGCIICFYLLFPLLRIGVKKYPLVTIIVATLLYILTAIFNPFKIELSRNILIRIYDFLFGMLLIKFLGKKKISVKTFLICLLVGITCCLIGSIQYEIFVLTIFGIVLFVSFVFIFERIDISTAYPVKQIGKYSYEIFLLHHVSINLYVNYFKAHSFSMAEGIVLFIGVVLVISIVVAGGKLFEREIRKIMGEYAWAMAVLCNQFVKKNK